MTVYVVISEFSGENVVERVYANEQDAIIFCQVMNRESVEFYYYSEQMVR